MILVELEKLFNGFSSIYVDERGKLYRENGKLAVHCKDFEVKYLQPNGGRKDLNREDVKSFLSNLLQEDKIKLITLLTPIPNMYYLCVLATVSKLLELFRNVNENIFKQLEFEILFVEILRDSERIQYLTEPFIKHTERIIDFSNKLRTGINILIPFDESLLNIMLKRIEILNVKMADKILKNMTYQNLNKYVEDVKDIEENWRKHLEKIEKDKRYLLSDGKILNERSRSVLFKTNMMHNVLKIFKKYTNPESKIILILGESVARVISDFISNNLIKINGNTMIIYFSDPVHPEDPPKILENIPSYITILSSYYNRKVISYGIDERYHAQMLKHLNEDILTFDLKDIIDKKRDGYESDKRHFIERFIKSRGEEHVNDVKEYAKNQEEILKIEGDMFLQVQNATLEQLKLLL